MASLSKIINNFVTLWLRLLNELVALYLLVFYYYLKHLINSNKSFCVDVISITINWVKYFISVLYMNKYIKNLSHYGDILAVPFFALLVIYFYNIEHKSIKEYILFFFSISGFVVDIFFTYMFLFHTTTRDD